MPGFKDYTIGWLVPLATEYNAVQRLLDAQHERLDYPEGTLNSYTLGRVGLHNVVVVYRNSLSIRSDVKDMAPMADEMMRVFPNLELCVVRGTGTNRNPAFRFMNSILGTPMVGEVGASIVGKHNKAVISYQAATAAFRDKVARRECDVSAAAWAFLESNPDMKNSFLQSDSHIFKFYFEPLGSNLDFEKQQCDSPPPAYSEAPPQLHLQGKHIINMPGEILRFNGKVPSVSIRPELRHSNGDLVPEVESYVTLLAAVTIQQILHELQRLS
jgi:hypothetical protein